MSSTDPLSVGFLSMDDPKDRRTWSGTVFQMTQALEQSGARLHTIGPMNTSPLRWDLRLTKLRRKLGATVPTPLRSIRAAKIFDTQISKTLEDTRPDVVFTPASSVLLAEFSTDIPVIYSSDSTVELLRNYYPKIARLDPATLAKFDMLERKAIQRADLIIYPTDWAANSAISHYGADATKVHVVPYGANLEAPTRKEALAAREDGIVNLIFIGVSWERKGGSIAIDALDDLTARGVKAHMTVVGCTPPEKFLRSNLTVIPFLDKNNPAERRKLMALYLAADLLLLPTRQECYGIVFCEAAAYGVPSITTATGGVPDVVKEGITGQTIATHAGGAAYADAIETLIAASGGLAAARQRARDDYEARLNWQVWGQNTYALMQGLNSKVL